MRRAATSRNVPMHEGVHGRDQPEQFVGSLLESGTTRVLGN
jgi:hypothetical protein